MKPGREREMSSQPLTVDSSPAIAREPEEPTLYLAAIEGKVERGLIDDWLAAHAPSGVAGPLKVIAYDKPCDAPVSEGLVESLVKLGDIDEETRFAPLRVMWRAGSSQELRAPSVRDLLFGRNPRDPKESTKERLATSTDRWQVVAAEPARLADLRSRWLVRADENAANDPLEFARFVARQAELSLERAEYRARGARYKLPRVFKEDVAGSSSFVQGLQRLAGELGRDLASVRREALECLDELRTAHDPFVLDRRREVVSPDVLQGIRRGRRRSCADRNVARYVRPPSRDPAAVPQDQPRQPCGRIGTGAAQPASADAVRRDQHGVLADGAADASRWPGIPAAQDRRQSGLQVRAARMAGLPDREAVQPGMVSGRHALAHRQAATAQARAAVLCRRRLSSGQRRGLVLVPMAIIYDQVVRGRGFRPRSARRGEEGREPRAG